MNADESKLPKWAQKKLTQLREFFTLTAKQRDDRERERDECADALEDMLKLYTGPRCAQVNRARAALERAGRTPKKGK